MSLQLQQVIIKLEQLTPERLVEVDDFINSLHNQDLEQHLSRNFTEISNAAFQKIWDNEDDAVYDKL